ncbi:MAG: hypothetical protein KKH40_05170 [Nanoarchaeota archaeon]|nr:hypothetical protein [Nanoarchaeota archaeon]
MSLSTIYVSDAIKNNNACGCVVPIPYMILILSSLGLFIGSLASYILISKFSREKKAISKDIEITLKFFSPDEQTIMRELIKNKDGLPQSIFEKETGLHRVKVHRVIEKLLSKGLIEKRTVGRTNKISLSEELKSIFQH